MQVKVGDVVRVVSDRFIDGFTRSGVVVEVGPGYVVTTERLDLDTVTVTPDGDGVWVFGWR